MLRKSGNLCICKAGISHCWEKICSRFAAQDETHRPTVVPDVGV